jgi:hypothetical protein
VRLEVGDPELAPPQLVAEGAGRAKVLHGPPEHAPRRPCLRRRLRLLLRQGLLVLYGGGWVWGLGRIGEAGCCPAVPSNRRPSPWPSRLWL